MTLRSHSSLASEPSSVHGSPRAVLLSAWAACALLTLLRAEDVRSWLSEGEHLRWARRDALVVLSRGVGLPERTTRAESLRAALYGMPSAPRPQPAPPPAVQAEVLTHVQVAPRPQRVLLVGASSMQFAVGRALERQLGAFEGLHRRRFAKVSTGLSRPDEFNWPARLEELLQEDRPDLVIANFGGNDAQNIPLPNQQRAAFGSVAWDDLYGERVRDFVLRIRARGAQAVMIGLPLMRAPSFSKRVQRLNRVTERATREAGGIYLDQWDLAATAQGTYREYVDEGGRAHAMRREDGIHYTDPGGRYVAARLLRRLALHVRLVPKNANLGVMERHDFTSSALGQPSHFLAWLPKSAGERVPLLILLHGADSGADDLAERLQTELQRAAQQHRIAIVAPDGGAGGWWLDSPELPAHRYASLVAADVLAAARASLPLTDAAGIAGISMGGHGALTIALAHPGTFRSASSLSGVLDLTLAGARPALTKLLGPLASQRARWEAHSALHQFATLPASGHTLALRISCGTEDLWVGANRAFRARAEALKVPLAYDEAAAGHSWSYWAELVPAHVAWHSEQLRASSSSR